MDFWQELGSPKYILAPMVEASELPWRILARRQGAQLCYTPMFHSAIFLKDQRYRKESLTSCDEDQPLFIQFCANNVDTFLQVSKIAAPYCKAIDLNLGCPQQIAKRGRYGAYLMDDLQLVNDMVRSVSGCGIKISCKVRIFDNIQKTVDYAKMLEAAGACLLTVHGRTREQKGPLTGLANWDIIKTIRQSVHIPMFANGNIQSLSDIERCIEETGVQGVMSAEGHLSNPAIFLGINPPVWEMSEKYLNIVEEYPCSMATIRGHIFKICRHLLALEENAKIRESIAVAREFSEIQNAVYLIREKYSCYHYDNLTWPGNLGNLKFYPWICQPYERIAPGDYIKKIKETKVHESCCTISKRQLKRLKKGKLKEPNNVGRNLELCSSCPNPSGVKCDFKLCKVCCRTNCIKNLLDCPGHRILLKHNKNTNID